MKPISGLFEPVPFLIRYPIYHQIFYQEEKYTLQLRIFSIIEDIALVYHWINKPRVLSSGHIESYQKHMLKYYKTNLDSSHAQSLMVILDSRGVCQFDVFPAQTDRHTALLASGPYDITVKYLADHRISPILFSHSLHLCLDYIFSFSGDFYTYIKLLPMGIIGDEVFTSIGCRYVKRITDNNGAVKIFSCTRNSLRNVNTEEVAG